MCRHLFYVCMIFFRCCCSLIIYYRHLLTPTLFLFKEVISSETLKLQHRPRVSNRQWCLSRHSLLPKMITYQIVKLLKNIMIISLSFRGSNSTNSSLHIRMMNGKWYNWFTLNNYKISFQIIQIIEGVCRFFEIQ